MAKDETPDVEEVVEEVEEELEENEETDDSWSRMENLVGKVVEEKLNAWQQSQKKTTSTHSPRKAAAKVPERKKGLFSQGFFSGLTDDK